VPRNIPRACNPVGFITPPTRLLHRRLRAEAWIATTEGVLERIVQHRCSHVEDGLHRRPVPAHLLFLVHAFGDDLVDSALNERGRDRFAIPAPGGVTDQRSLVPLEVGQQLADVVFQAPYASHAA
jgi:hypothetical protein